MNSWKDILTGACPQNAALVGAFLLAGVSACGGVATSDPPGAMLGSDFVSMRKALSGGSSHDTAAVSASVSGVSSSGSDGDFYVGIKKSLLGSRWFLAAFMKQFHPDNVPLLESLGITDSDQLLADLPLGTRVVSFKIQNDRLFMFDASDRFQETPLQDPSVLVEAYPLIDSPDFDALPGSEDYVLFDPSQGLNAFHLAGQIYADPYLEYASDLQLGLSYLQDFRTLPDGVAFEQVFSGAFDTGEAVGTIQAWGTLGVALRRYQEGAHYTPTADAGKPFYFSNQRFVPNGAGSVADDLVHWDFHPGMAPVKVYVSAGAYRAQDDFPSVDILGAITRGIESWNDAFGFPVYQAVLTHEDRIRDDGASFLLVDYPGPNATSYGPVQLNPNTGEIRSANVYLASGTFDELARLGLSAYAATDAAAPARSAPHAHFTIAWAGMTPSPGVCNRPPSPLLGPTRPADPLDAATLAEQGAAWVQDFVVHELGHTLGLRHNFAGSLVSPGGTSVMDYQTLRDSVALPVPGSYDIAAIRYLYQLSSDPPTQAFCTDEDTTLDPNCAAYDEGSTPLSDFWIPGHAAELDRALDSGVDVSADDLDYLDGLLGFARDDATNGSVSADDRAAAFKAAIGRAGVPLAAADTAQPAVIGRANGVLDLVLRRAVLDPAANRGPIQLDITDPGVLTLIVEQAAQVLGNADGVRSYALRRTAVDVLARLQSDAALVALRNARDALGATLDTGTLGPSVKPLAQDLLARIDGALNPYFH